MSDRLRQVFDKHSKSRIITSDLGGTLTTTGVDKSMSLDNFIAAVNELNAPYEELIQSYHDYVLLIGEEDLSEGTFKLIWEGKDYSND